MTIKLKPFDRSPGVGAETSDRRVLWVPGRYGYGGVGVVLEGCVPPIYEQVRDMVV